MPYVDVRLLFKEDDDYTNELKFYGVTISDTDLDTGELKHQAETIIQSDEPLTEMICELMTKDEQ